jgi:general secretion pathway protein D
VGRLFRADTDASHTVELVVFLRATILPDDTGGTIAPADIDLYRGFTTDPRPLPFPAASPSPATTPPSTRPVPTPGRSIPESESTPQ